MSDTTQQTTEPLPSEIFASGEGMPKDKPDEPIPHGPAACTKGKRPRRCEDKEPMITESDNIIKRVLLMIPTTESDFKQTPAEQLASDGNLIELMKEMYSSDIYLMRGAMFAMCNSGFSAACELNFTCGMIQWAQSGAKLCRCGKSIREHDGCARFSEQ